MSVRRFMCVRYWLAFSAKKKSCGVGWTQPSTAALGVGEPVERRVDLDRVEPRRVVLEPPPRGQARRVEDLPPALVLPARAADAHGPGGHAPGATPRPGRTSRDPNHENARSQGRAASCPAASQAPRSTGSR